MVHEIELIRLFIKPIKIKLQTQNLTTQKESYVYSNLPMNWCDPEGVELHFAGMLL